MTGAASALVGCFPHPRLAAQLLPHTFDKQDGAHDDAHLLRVWRNVEKIVGVEGGDTEILTAATLLHDCVWIDKTAPHRAQASSLAAAKAGQILAALHWPDRRINQVSHAIAAHSFSAAIPPRSLEAKVLQDADRLDAMGFIGLARCFYLTGARGSAIYDPADPAARDRPLDETRFALDHFQTKLLRLGDNFQTGTGQKLATERAAILRACFDGLLAEIG